MPPAGHDIPRLGDAPGLVCADYPIDHFFRYASALQEQIKIFVDKPCINQACQNNQQFCISSGQADNGKKESHQKKGGRQQSKITGNFKHAEKAEYTAKKTKIEINQQNGKPEDALSKPGFVFWLYQFDSCRFLFHKFPFLKHMLVPSWRSWKPDSGLSGNDCIYTIYCYNFLHNAQYIVDKSHFSIAPLISWFILPGGSRKSALPDSPFEAP